jgi:MFS family permease
MTMQAPVEFPEPEIQELVPQQEGYGAVLRNKNFMALWIGQILSQLGDRVIFVVFIAMVALFFGSSERYNSFLYIAFTIPAILLTAIAGVFVDRWPRRAVLVATNILRALFVALVPFVSKDNPWTLYWLAFGLSSATQFFVPAEAATIPSIVSKSQLITANSLFTTTMMASVIFGFVLGDPLINLFGLEQVHWSIVTLFVLSSIALMFLKVPPMNPMERGEEDLDMLRPKSVGAATRKFFAELKEGIQYIRENKMILHAMLKLALMFSAVVALCLLFVSFAKEFLYRDPLVAARKFAYIITFSGIGMVLGAYTVGQYFRQARRGWMVFSGFTVLGGMLALLCLVDQFSQSAIAFDLVSLNLTWRMVYTYLLSAIMGVAGAFIAIPLQALLHELIPEDKRGKILGVQFTILSTSSTLPALIAGVGAEQVGTKAMLLLLGVPMLIVGLRGLYHRVITPNATVANW